ncbi:MAG: RNA methyltransferase [Alphaproteobacteria bacterium]|nr:RNA methyltransferase [Alphaproteobacteria bacterium]
MSAVILVHPQMGENIGAAARAMLNFGLTDLRLVAPRDGWPSAQAEAMSSGALEKMPPVQVFDTFPEAIADLHYVLATTARPRDMVKPVLTPSEAAIEGQKRAQGGQRTGFAFGAERSGLFNEDIAACHSIITVPTNPDFSSLNLGQSVLLVAYEWFKAGLALSDDGAFPAPAAKNDNFPAEQGEIEGFLSRLEDELDAMRFFRAPELKPITARNIRNIFTRADITDQELRTLHGIVSALKGNKL